MGLVDRQEVKTSRWDALKEGPTVEGSEMGPCQISIPASSRLRMC